MIRYSKILQTRTGNKTINYAVLLLIPLSIYLSLNTQVDAIINRYLDPTPSANFIYKKYTKKNQATIKIIDKKNINKIFFNGLESRDNLKVQLQEGENDFIFILVGNNIETKQDLTIIKDTKPPIISTSFKFKDMKTYDNILQINGELNELGDIFINGVLCSSGIKITCKYEIKGKVLITFLILDRAGNKFEKKFFVEQLIKPQEIKIGYDHSTYLSQSSITTIVNEPLSSVTVNGIDMIKQNTTTFFLDVNLAIGINRFKIVAKDNHNSITTHNIEIERKIYKPISTVVSTPTPAPMTPSTIVQKEGCNTISLNLYNVKTPIFVNEIQTAKVRLSCDNSQVYANHKISINIKYADDTTQNYSTHTNSLGVADFSFNIPNIPGDTLITARYDLATTNVIFKIN